MTETLAETIGRVPNPADAARRGVLRRLMANPLGVIALVVLLIVVLAGVFGQWLAPFEANRASLADALKPPGGGHLLGTDSAGRDIVSRLLIGAQTTLIAAAVAAATAIEPAGRSMPPRARTSLGTRRVPARRAIVRTTPPPSFAITTRPRCW